MKELTPRQESILSFIEKYWEEQAISPSFREIQDFFGFKSPHAVSKHLDALEKKGYITFRRGHNFTKARSILVLRTKEIEVPLVGKIVAGTPVESIENLEARWDLTFLGINNSNKDYFALTVKGDSMILAHILEGDMVVIKKQADVSEKDVAAVLWNNEATLKYVYKHKNSISLVPANDTMNPIQILPENTNSFRILGRVITVIRRY